MFLKNERGMGVKNGTLGKVERVSPDSMAVRLDDGRQVAFDLKDYAHVDHGYAATIHKSQGVTVDQGHVLATPGMDRHSAYVALSRHRDGVQLHYGRDDFADDRRLVRTLGRERAKDMASDYPMYRDRDAEAQSFADRRGLSGEIRVADAPERKGVEILAPRAGTSRQMGEDLRPRDIGGGRGAGEAKAAAERQPRRGMFDGFGRAAERTGERTAEPVQGAKERRPQARHVRRLKLSAAGADAGESTPRVPSRAIPMIFAARSSDLAFGRGGVAGARIRRAGAGASEGRARARRASAGPDQAGSLARPRIGDAARSGLLREAAAGAAGR
jgi:hypothetical protein